MKAWCFIIFISGFNILHAQTRQTITIKPGENAREKLWEEVYQYPQFMKGKAWAKNGEVSGGLMNYNRISGKMDFIDNKGDTLVLDGETALHYISIGKDTFYIQNGYLQKLPGYSRVTFAVQQRLAYVDAHKIGAMGIPSKTANIEAKAAYENDKRFNLSIHEEQVFSKQHFYFIQKDNSAFLPLTRKNILKLFSRHKQKLEDFMERNNTQFDEAQSIWALMAFIDSL